MKSTLTVTEIDGDTVAFTKLLYIKIQHLLYKPANKDIFYLSASYIFQFINTYQSLGITTKAWTGITFTKSFFFFFFPFSGTPWKFYLTGGRVKKKTKTSHFKDTSEVQVLIGRSVGVHTRALCCKCLRLCSMLT